MLTGMCLLLSFMLRAPAFSSTVEDLLPAAVVAAAVVNQQLQLQQQC
jgi:biopolymer transport protein ExbD